MASPGSVRGPGATALAAGRRAAEALMTERCRVTRRPAKPRRGPDGRDVWEDATLWEGQCRVRVLSAWGQQAEGAGHVYVTSMWTVHLPVAAPLCEVGDLITVEGYAHPYRVTSPMEATLVTAQRVQCQEVVA